jgi:hypothetical protein
MIWEIVFHKDFEEWWSEQNEALQDSMAMVLNLLEEFGTNLGRPYVDTLKGSLLTNLKELRVQHKGEPYRLLFVFDPQRQAVVLVGGNKAGDKRWYEKNIAIAEKRYTEYLKDTKGGTVL